ncbi:MAG: hypothetical protein GWN58_27925 [Anaerolineae bacterium]|nr:hypothetical protein [Anaerolineae bacterium]
MKPIEFIIADPAWKYNNRRAIRRDTKVARFGIGASTRYHCETTKQMATIPVSNLAADRAQLYMWVTCPFLPGGLWLMDAWGFSFITVAFVWIKCNPRPWAKPVRQLAETLLVENNLAAFLTWLTFYGPGHYTASNIELVLLGGRGKPAFKPTKCARQLIFAPRMKHSRKPDDVHKRIEQMYPGHSYAELFARRQYPSWLCLGDEIDGLDMRESIPRYLEGKYAN